MPDDLIAVCSRCGRETSQIGEDFVSWEVVSGGAIVCDHCLTREEEQELIEQFWDGGTDEAEADDAE